jgi:two-component system chemotaxis sensor kinase CheA
VNVKEIETICQTLEGVFAALKRKEIALSSELFDVLHRAVDTLNKLLLSMQAERTASEMSLINELIQRLESALKGVPQPEAFQPPAMEKSVPEDTVRISTAKLDSLLLQAEELVSAKLTANYRAAELLLPSCERSTQHLPRGKKSGQRSVLMCSRFSIPSKGMVKRMVSGTDRGKRIRR